MMEVQLPHENTTRCDNRIDDTTSATTDTSSDQKTPLNHLESTHTQGASSSVDSGHDTQKMIEQAVDHPVRTDKRSPNEITNRGWLISIYLSSWAVLVSSPLSLVTYIFTFHRRILFWYFIYRGAICISLSQNFAKPDKADRAVSWYRSALLLSPLLSTEHEAIALFFVASAHQILYDLGGATNNNETARNTYQKALRLSPSHPGLCLEIKNNIGNCFLAQYKLSSNAEDLEEAISWYHDALPHVASTHQARAMPLNNLATCLRTQYEKHGDIKALEQAIEYNKDALALSLPTFHRSTILSNLGTCVMDQYRQSGEMHHLDEAIRLFKEASSFLVGFSDRAVLLNKMAYGLYTRFNQQGNMDDLDGAIWCLNKTLQLLPSGHIDRSTSVSSLASCLQARYWQQGNIQDIENATRYNKELLLQHPPGHSNRAMSLSNVASCLGSRYARKGNVEDLDEAIRCYWDALQLHPPGHSEWPLSLTKLAVSLNSRYSAQGDIHDLEEAIHCYRSALVICRPEQSDGSQVLVSLANSLRHRFDHQGDMQDLEEAIQLHSDALKLRTPGHPARLESLSDLGGCLHVRYQQLGDAKDLDEATLLYQEAYPLCPAEHPLRATVLYILATGLEAQYRLRGNVQLLEEAIRYILEVALICDVDHPFLATTWSSLAFLYATYSHLLTPTPRSQLVTELFQMAITHQTASLRSRITCARRWIAVAKEGDLIHAYEKTIELVDQYLLIQSSISTRHQILLDKLIPKSLASDAAATAIAGGEIKKAVQFLEQGRALLWSQMSQYRTPLQELQNVDSNLANEFARLSRLLETSALPQLDNDTSFHSSQLEARTYRQVSDAWRTVVAQIRKLDGFQSFLLPPTYAVLLEAARNGPVIVINISSYRSDAIILHPDGNPHVVPLHVQPQQIEILHSKFSEATRATKPRKVLLSILNTLWDDIVEPIVHKLQDLEIKRGSRIWWCPTSHLAMLPLHAAGHYRGDRPNLPEFYISSYTPTLTALLRSRETNLSRAPSGIPQLLVVAQSLVIDQPRIPSVQSEVETVEKIAPRVDVLHGQNITRDSVLTFLHDHPWVHFTCHGSQKPRPFDSCFHLYDEPLTLMDIMQARLPDAQYAFLSACHSAAGDTDKPDETIHLAAALQFSGFRSVIGTMYAMADEDGPALAEQVYKHMFRRVGKGKGKEGKDEMVVDFRDAAEALHTAVKALREREEGFPLERWINFVHIGV